jgi:hypothetical protein
MLRVQSNVLPGYSKTQQLLGNDVMQRVQSNMLPGYSKTQQLLGNGVMPRHHWREPID